MLKRLYSLSLAVIIVVPVLAQDGKADLKWKFEKDKAFYQELITNTTQDMKVMGQDVKQTQKQVFYFSWKPIKEEKGVWTIEQTIDGVKMNIEIGGNKIDYDSSNPGTGNNPLADFFKALVGSKFTLTVENKDGKWQVIKVDGRKEFVDKLGGTNPQMKPLLDSILSDEALRQMADPSFAAVQGKETKVGDEWKYSTKLNLGPIGAYDTTYTYKYDGKDEKQKELDKISVKTTLKYIPPDAGAVGGGLPFKITKSTLDSKTAGGTILFDAKAGRIESSEMNMTLEGTLDIDIGGMKTTVELKQVQKTTVRMGKDSFLKKETPPTPPAPPAPK